MLHKRPQNTPNMPKPIAIKILHQMLVFGGPHFWSSCMNLCKKYFTCFKRKSSAFSERGADSSKGDFLPSPSGGPLVRFLAGYLLWFGCLDLPISAGFGFAGGEQDSHPL